MPNRDWLHYVYFYLYPYPGLEMDLIFIYLYIGEADHSNVFYLVVSLVYFDSTYHILATALLNLFETTSIRDTYFIFLHVYMVIYGIVNKK